jgi:hypothetical protein
MAMANRPAMILFRISAGAAGVASRPVPFDIDRKNGLPERNGCYPERQRDRAQTEYSTGQFGRMQEPLERQSSGSEEA